MEILQNDEFFKSLPLDIKAKLERLNESSANFSFWFNLTKIKSKFKGAKELEDIHDVTAELRCAAYLLNPNNLNSLTYEPLHQQSQSLDFLAVLCGYEFILKSDALEKHKQK